MFTYHERILKMNEREMINEAYQSKFQLHYILYGHKKGPVKTSPVSSIAL